MAATVTTTTDIKPAVPMDTPVRRKPVASQLVDNESSSGSSGDEDDGNSSGSGSGGGSGTRARGIKRKPVSKTAASATLSSSPPPRPPVTIKFALGPIGLHCWYDSSAPYARPQKKAAAAAAATTKTTGTPAMATTASTARTETSEKRSSAVPSLSSPMSPTFDDLVEYEARPFSCSNDQRRWIMGEESPLRSAATIQMYNCSPNFVTASIIIDEEGNQQHKVLPPHKPLIPKFGKMKREHGRSIVAEQDLNGWLTICLINNVAPRDLTVSFGPDESFYALSSDKRVVKRGLPIDLQRLLDSHDEPPKQLSIGIDSTWWVQWSDGTTDQYIQQNSYPDLCALLENLETPQLKRIQLNPAKGNEFLVEYANGHFFLRSRCQAKDLEQLNAYLKQQKSEIKVVVLGVLAKHLEKDIVCEPFVLPIDDFEHAPIMVGRELNPGQLPEWMEFTKGGIELAKAVTDTARAGGACTPM